MTPKPLECKGCPMFAIGQGYAPPSGPPDSNICVVGEALGVEEVRTSKPFSGGAGRVLASLLKGAGMSREFVRVDNAMRCRPPGNVIPKNFDPIECSRRHLFPALAKQKPNIIIALGNNALNVLTGLDKITKRRGSLFTSVHGKVLPTLHPAHLMRNQSMWFIVIADLRKAQKESLFSDIIPLKTNYNKMPTLTDIQAFATSPYTKLSMDIETSYDKYWENALICIGFSTLDQTICIPWLKQGGGLYWSPRYHKSVVMEINRLLSHPLIMQNGFFDVQVLEAIGFDIPNFFFDTMLAHHLLYAELPHDLGFICSMHTPMPYYKDESKSDAGALALSDDVFRGYNCNDALATYLAAEDLYDDLKKTGKWDHFQAVTMKLPRILLDMQRRGILVDTAVLKEAIISYTTQVKAIALELEELGVPKGDNALKIYLFEELKLPVVKRSKITRSPSLDKDTFEKLHVKIITEKGKYDEEHPRFKVLSEGEHALTLISDKKQRQKTLSTYLRGLPIGPDGRVHCRWLQHGTKNQRLSSRDPNLQNVPEGIARRIYSASPGKLLYVFDYSQIELRIIAYDAEDLDLIKCFETGQDVHDSVARDLFNIPPGEPVPHKIRKFTKSCEYCWNYGGDITAVLMVYPGLLSIGQAKRAQAEYFRKRPALARYRKAIEDEVKISRSVTDPFGLKRIIFGNLKDNIRSAYNNPLQSGAAYVINTACIRLWRKGLTSNLLLQVHDSLVFELPTPNDVMSIKNIMEVPVYIKKRKVELPVDVQVGPNWDSLEKLSL